MLLLFDLKEREQLSIRDKAYLCINEHKAAQKRFRFNMLRSFEDNHERILQLADKITWRKHVYR